MLCAISLKDDVLSDDFSDFNCEVSRETNTSTLWKIATDLYPKVDGMDMCIPICVTDTEHEDFLMMYQHEATDSLVLLRGYVLKAE
jgi:hypothetical protein